MSFGLYMGGFVVMVVGLAIGANMMHVPAHWIGVGILVMVGLGLMMAVSNTRGKDPS